MYINDTVFKGFRQIQWVAVKQMICNHLIYIYIELVNESLTNAHIKQLTVKV